MDKVTKDQADRIIKELEHTNRTLESFLKISKRHNPSIGDQDQANKQQSDASVGWPNPVIGMEPRTQTTPQTKARWYQPKHFGGSLLERWKPRIEFVAVFFAIAYAVITFFQWRDAASNFQIDQRAWVGARGVVTSKTRSEIDDKSEMFMSVTNTGKTPAIDAYIIGRSDSVDKGKTPIPIDYSKPSPRNPYGTILPGQIIETEIPIVNNNIDGSPAPVPSELIQALERGDKAEWIRGRVYYRDAFGHTHWTGYCLIAQPNLKDYYACKDGQNEDTDTEMR